MGAGVSENGFFTKARPASRVKARIVAKYLPAWANVMDSHARKMCYIDLFAGPGRYEDGTPSTPLLVLSEAISDHSLCEKLQVILNDADEANVAALRQAILGIEGVKDLKHEPQVSCSEVNEEVAKQFHEVRIVPSLIFIDPFGYKGVTLDLIQSVLKDWGCDCIVFFNYKRVNMGLNRPVVRKHIDGLFGVQRALRLRRQVPGMNPRQREQTLMSEFAEALAAIGGQHVLAFRFRDEAGLRTSHHLVFVTKHPLGFDIMKNIMAKESTAHHFGSVPFEYDPTMLNQAAFFREREVAAGLDEMLLDSFAGLKLGIDKIYREHNVGTPYVRSDYVKVLDALANHGRIETLRMNGKKRRPGTFPPDVLAVFPPRD
jgi:three-Cys-motif partner protein